MVSRFTTMVAKFLHIPDGAAVWVTWAAWVAAEPRWKQSPRRSDMPDWIIVASWSTANQLLQDSLSIVVLAP